jgi:hypothetical protein
LPRQRLFAIIETNTGAFAIVSREKPQILSSVPGNPPEMRESISVFRLSKERSFEFGSEGQSESKIPAARGKKEKGVS